MSRESSPLEAELVICTRVIMRATIPWKVSLKRALWYSRARSYHFFLILKEDVT